MSLSLYKQTRASRYQVLKHCPTCLINITVRAGACLCARRDIIVWSSFGSRILDSKRNATLMKLIYLCCFNVNIVAYTVRIQRFVETLNNVGAERCEICMIDFFHLWFGFESTPTKKNISLQRSWDPYVGRMLGPIFKPIEALVKPTHSSLSIFCFLILQYILFIT